MRFFLISICASILFFLPGNTQAQYWRTFTNPLYKAHWKINENQHLNAQKILQKRASTPDTLNPIYWHSLTRIAEHLQQPDSAIYYARKAVINIQMLQKSTDLYAEFLRIYILDAYYLDLYYRKLLYQKYHTQRSTTSPIANNKLLGFYLQESQKLAQYLPLTNVNRRITLPLITENLNALNDTIAFNRVIQTKNTQKTWNYLQELGSSDPQIQQLPIHLKSFYISARDSFYTWTYEEVVKVHSEQEYLNFIQKFPSAPQVTHALTQADELAFAQCRNAHSAPIYTSYLEKYPYGKYRKQAKMLLRYLTVVPVPFARADGKYVFVDSINMRPWIDSAYDFAYPFCLKHHRSWNASASTLVSGCALVMNTDEFERNQWYYIEKDGSPLNDKRYDEIRQISSQMAVVTKSNHYGLIDKLGRELLPPIFNKIFVDTLNRIGFVHNGEFWALFNSNGKRITKFEFTSFEKLDENIPVDWAYFHDNRILVRNETTQFFIDFNGNQFFLGSFTHLEPFYKQYSVAHLPNNLQLIIDTAGNAKSDTFTRIESLYPGIYNAFDASKPKQQTLLILDSNLQIKTSHYASEKPIKLAWYWNKPLFLIENKNEISIYNTLDSLLYKDKNQEVYVHANTVFVQNLRKNPKSRLSPTVKKWFNPYKNTFSEINAEDIGVLANERLTVYQQQKAYLFNINEQQIPFFYEDKNTPEVAKITNIHQLNRATNFLISTDSMQAVSDENGRITLPFTKGQIEEFSSDLFWITNEKGSFIVNQKNQNILGPFEEINEDGFPGYWLIKQNDRWIWVDAKKRWFGESE